MRHSEWKGSISFGLVSIPVVLYPAINKAADIYFHQIDKHNNARIKYQRINAVTGKVVKWDDIIKGYEYDKDTMIPVPEEILVKVAGQNAKTIAIETFISQKEFDIITINRAYYIAPGKNGEKGYVILREALSSTEKIAIAKVIISTREYLAAVAARPDKSLALYLLNYAKEMRDISEIKIPTKNISTYKVDQKEINIAKQLISSMSEKWAPEKFIDEYQKMVHQWAHETATKSPHRIKIKTPVKKKSSNVVNFIDLLKKSLSKKEKPKPLLKNKKTGRKTVSTS